MYLVAHRATERGADHALALRLEIERAKRVSAQKAAWQAVQALAEEKEHRRQENIERSLAMVAELRSQGIRYRQTYRVIEARACRLFRVKQSEIRSDRRHREIVFARQFVMYWAVRLTKLSLPQIGRLMGGRDHTTIIHGRDVYPEKRVKMGRYLRPAK
jgi:chromosomal replication initiation ATPase DnaA